MKFYKCAHCGNIILFANNADVPVTCCGQKMEEMISGTSDGASEKHVPVMKAEGQKITVEVGSVAHPMLEKHYIQWVVLETEKGFQKAELKPGEAPKAEFALTEGDHAVAAYEYCNLHGLWETRTIAKA